MLPEPAVRHRMGTLRLQYDLASLGYCFWRLIGTVDTPFDESRRTRFWDDLLKVETWQS